MMDNSPYRMWYIFAQLPFYLFALLMEFVKVSFEANVFSFYVAKNAIFFLVSTLIVMP